MRGDEENKEGRRVTILIVWRFVVCLNLTCGACFKTLAGICIVRADEIFSQIVMIGFGRREGEGEDRRGGGAAPMLLPPPPPTPPGYTTANTIGNQKQNPHKPHLHGNIVKDNHYHPKATLKRFTQYIYFPFDVMHFPAVT